MEGLKVVLKNIDVPANKVETSSIQDVLKMKQFGQCKCSMSDPCDCLHVCKQIAAKLFDHLHNGLEKFDDQLLCATAFYTALNNTDENTKQCYLEKVHRTVECELTRKKVGNTEIEKTETVAAVALMYGIFQSSFLTPTTDEMYQELDRLDFEPVLKTMTELLFLMAYDYSKFTYIVFKTMASFDKISGYPFEPVVFNYENVKTMLNVIIHNWENPITGVRDLNKKLYSTLINVWNEKYRDSKPLFSSSKQYDFLKISYSNHQSMCLQEIDKFSLNKAKCLMLAENIKGLNIKPFLYTDFVCSTLMKPGLVAAGADLYYAILEKIQTQKEWSDIFLQKVIDIYNGKSEKAIQNFTDYWCLPTLKKYPELKDELLKKLGDLDESELKWYSGLCLLQQANRLGLVKKKCCTIDSNSIENYVLPALEHSNTKIRILAFNIICVSHSKDMPTKTEYGLVIDYIHHNMNSDCRVLRINMLKSLESFLKHLHGSYLITVKNQQKFNEGDLFNFCNEYQELIVSSFNINGNYQRKIACIQLLDIFLTNLSHIQRKRQGESVPEFSLLVTLKTKNHLTFMKPSFMKTLLKLTNDAADDIRDHVVVLLSVHYTVQLSDTEVFNELIDGALHCLSSKFFYDISCGHTKFKLILNTLAECQRVHDNVGVHGTRYKSIKDVFDFAFESLISEYKLGRGVVESIEEGKQLHSYISLLQEFFLVCLQRKNFIAVSSDQFEQLLTVLEGVSNQFAWVQDDTSSDFSMMNDMVEDLIRKSGIDATAEATKLSSLHQIVLNSLWLNVKASCELASIVVQTAKFGLHTESEICERALRVITRVLETCRHKGAIEAAGVALGNAIRRLTSWPTCPLSDLPQSLLHSKLQELTQTSAMASVTRRGAGLSIMFHRIVASDSRREKPLFHHFMRTVLCACSDSDAQLQERIGEIVADTEKDIPKAVYIHFLTRIVTDSSLTCDVLYYADKLAELAFGNLTSPHWQIRNAALQLYGALLPKLIGQKKPSAYDDPAATLACDELRTHLPKLWKYMTDTLNQSQPPNENDLEHHSNLVPILNVLASCGKRYNFSDDLNEQKNADSQLFESLQHLLQSRIYTVRKLAAKAIYNIYHHEEEPIRDFLDWNLCNWLSQNILNGCLMLLELCVKGDDDNTKLRQDSLYPRSHTSLYHYLSDDTFMPSLRNYVNKLQYLETFSMRDKYNTSIINTLKEVKRYFYAPGIIAWSKRFFELAIPATPWQDMPGLMKIILNLICITHGFSLTDTPDDEEDEEEYYYEFKFKGFDSEMYCQIIFSKLEQDSEVPKEVLLQISDLLLTTKKITNSTITWKMLYEISKRVDPKEIGNTEDMLQIVTNCSKVSYSLRYIIPFAARIVPSIGNQEAVSHLSCLIFSLTDVKTFDHDMRYIAALSIIELAKQFRILPEQSKVAAIKSAIILLQDEDEDIRNASIQFYKNLIKTKRAPHPYVCLTRILDHELLSTVLTEKGIQSLCDQLTKLLDDLSTSKIVDEYNPFANESYNIYMETDVLKKLVEGVKLTSSNIAVLGC